MTHTGGAPMEIAPLPGASLAQAMRRFARGTFRLRGRASRSEYWWWMVLNIVVLTTAQLFVPALVSGSTPRPTILLGPFGSWLFANIELINWNQTDAPSSPVAAFFLVLAGLWLIVTVIPAFSVAVRRFHDSNLSGWWVLLAFVPIGSFVLLLLAARRSRPEGTRFDAALP